MKGYMKGYLSAISIHTKNNKIHLEPFNIFLFQKTKRQISVTLGWLTWYDITSCSLCAVRTITVPRRTSSVPGSKPRPAGGAALGPLCPFCPGL